MGKRFCKWGDGHLMATTVTILSTDTNNCLESAAENVYADAHDAASADSLVDELKLGQINSGTQNTIYRAFLYFDTSTLPDDAIIISAKLRLRMGIRADDDKSEKEFNIVIRRNSAGTYPSDPLHVDDFDYTFYTSDLGSLNTVYITASGVYYIWLNDIGKDWIKVDGTTKIALISSCDINAIAPIFETEEWIRFYKSGSHADYTPALVITYSAEEYPTVTTQAATNTGNIYCTAHGTLTDGGVATSWGFEYGESEVPTWIVEQTGNIGEQAFQLGIPGLEPSTTYYYRAFCTNSFGTAYGDWVTFTTSATPSIPSYGIHEESNAATICFYVRRAGGKWSIKHGPYTTDQTDIEIGKILTEGKGKYQIKFTSNALTGLSVNIMTKLDIKARS